MALSNNHLNTKLIIHTCVLYLLVSSLLTFSAPLQKKHVIIRNSVSNTEDLNVHCSSTEDDLGLKHLPYAEQWSFNFKVNFLGSTKFRCHFTWRGGGDHWFTIYDDGRNGNECKTCFWDVIGPTANRYGEGPLFRSAQMFGYRVKSFDWDK